MKAGLSGVNEALKSTTNSTVTSEAELLDEALDEVTLLLVYV